MKLKHSVITCFLLAVLITLAGCGGGAQTTEPPAPSPTSPSVQATTAPEATEAAPEATSELPTATSEPPTATSEPPTAPPEPTATPVSEQVTLKFVTPLGTIEELEPILQLIEQREGILGGFGSEIEITINYDPEVLTVDDVIALMEQINKPVVLP